MLISDMVLPVNDPTARKLAEALLRIFLASESNNCGIVNGESVLCFMHASAAYHALVEAGVEVPEWAAKRFKEG